MRRMNIGELKASLRRSGLPATGERRDLERTCSAPRAPAEDARPEARGGRAAARGRRRRARGARQIPEDVLRVC